MKGTTRPSMPGLFAQQEPHRRCAPLFEPKQGGRTASPTAPSTGFETPPTSDDLLPPLVRFQIFPPEEPQPVQQPPQPVPASHLRHSHADRGQPQLQLPAVCARLCGRHGQVSKEKTKKRIGPNVALSGTSEPCPPVLELSVSSLPWSHAGVGERPARGIVATRWRLSTRWQTTTQVARIICGACL